MKTPLHEVKDKVAFIAGGSSGIGLGIARAFADAGMKVAIGYRTQSHLVEAMQSLKHVRDRVHAISVDVTDRPAMKRAAAEVIDVFGKLHVLVNNAGVTTSASLLKTTYDDWDYVMDINLNGVFNGIRAFLPHIQAHEEGGHVITTSSLLGLLVLNGDQAAYIASKFAIVGMMEALRAELVGTSIGVSIFCPGLVTSNVWDSGRNRPGDLPDMGVKPDPQLLAQERAGRADPETAMDPFEAGRLVLRGMINNDLYILTHPEFEPILRDRNEALITSIPSDLQPTERRIAMVRSVRSTTIYALEADRLSGRIASEQTRQSAEWPPQKRSGTDSESTPPSPEKGSRPYR